MRYLVPVDSVATLMKDEDDEWGPAPDEKRKEVLHEFTQTKNYILLKVRWNVYRAQD